MKWQACFCPQERRGNPPSVALSKCSENSAAAPTVPLVLLYYALLRPAGAPTYYLVTIRSRMNCTTLSRMPLIEILHAVQSARWFRDPLKGLIDGTPSWLPGLYPDEQCCPKELLFDWENAWHSWHRRVIVKNTHMQVTHAFVSETSLLHFVKSYFQQSTQQTCWSTSVPL